MWVTCIESLSPLRSAPSHRAEMVCQGLFGETGELLDWHGEWWYIRRWVDGYVGWGLASGWMKGGLPWPWGVVKRRWAPLWLGQRRIGWLPAGAFFPLSGQWLTPYGIFRIAKGALREFIARPIRIQKLQTDALLYLGSPYLWGGKTPAGIDCSGLIQMLLRLQGWLLPRDSIQQWRFLSPVVGTTRAGDVLFFSDKPGSPISHVGIMYDAATLLHSYAHGGVQKIPLSHLSTHTFHSVRTFKPDLALYLPQIPVPWVGRCSY
ncbi:MAG: C40 family peptidase [Bacteroidia bacterium]